MSKVRPAPCTKPHALRISSRLFEAHGVKVEQGKGTDVKRFEKIMPCVRCGLRITMPADEPEEPGEVCSLCRLVATMRELETEAKFANERRLQALGADGEGG